MSKGKKTLIIVLIVVAAALAVCVGVLVYASSHMKFTVNGLEVEGKSDAELAEEIADEEEEKEVDLKEGSSVELSGKITEFGYSVNRDTLSDRISEAIQKEKENPLVLLKSLRSVISVEAEPDWVLDTQTFQNFVKSSSFSTERRETQQASLTYDKEAGKYVAATYDAGNEIDDSKLQSLVKSALNKALGGSVQEGDSAEAGNDSETVSSGSGNSSSASGTASLDSEEVTVGSVKTYAAGNQATVSPSSTATPTATSAAASSLEASSDNDASSSAADNSVSSASAVDAASSSSEESAGDSGTDGAAVAPDDAEVTVSEKKIEITLPSSIYIVEEEDSSAETAENLQAEADALNKYVGAKINYTFGSETVTLDFSTISGWLSYSDGQVTFDEEAMKNYISDMAQKYNTRHHTRTFTTSSGTQITFDGSDNEYGYTIDEDAELTQMKADIESGKEVTREPCYVTQNSYGNPYYLKRNGTDDLAGTYVEVDITKQHLWFYKDGQLIVESDVVTGLPTEDRATKTGVFPLAYKESPSNLSSDVNGYSTDVNYWMPFYEGQGLHDATWRSSFGGSIYKTDGSHGCVNLPLDVAATIYNNIDTGTAIIIYQS